MEWGNHPWNRGANALEMIHSLRIDLTNDDSDGGNFVHNACVCGFVIVLSPRFYHVADTCRGRCRRLRRAGGHGCAAHGTALAVESASSAIKAGSPFGFGYSAMSATDADLWTSLKTQDAAAKDMLYKMTGDEDVWVRTVSDRVGNQLKDKLNYKRPIWVTALSPHVCFLG